jgi:hypothetical protein
LEGFDASFEVGGIKKKDQRFIRLFKETKKKKIETILQLQRWIEYLKENKYNADINQLKNG